MAGVTTLAQHGGMLNGEHITIDLISMISGDKAATQSVVDLFLMLYNKIEAHEIEVQQVSDQLGLAEDQIKALEIELGYLNSENNLLRHKIAITDDNSRTMYLRLEGLSETLNNNLPLHVVQTLSKTGVICNISDIDYTKRIGKFKEGTTRPILIRFIREGKRNSIFYNRANINKNRARGDPLLWLNDDISDETRRHRKTVRDIAALAKQEDITVRVHDDGIIVDNNKYRHIDLDLLPTKISIEKAKSRDEPTGIYFQSEKSPYSNHYPSRFVDEQGQTFENVEQAYQFKKAKAHNKMALANKILETRDPPEIHRLAKQLPTSKNWIKEEEQIMTDLVTMKFTQNPHIRNLLLATENKEFHEATSNKKWGTGAELASNALLNGDWNGEDLLGQILERVRTNLKLVYPIPPDPFGSSEDVNALTHVKSTNDPPTPHTHTARGEGGKTSPVLAQLQISARAKPMGGQLPTPAAGSKTPTTVESPHSSAGSPVSTQAIEEISNKRRNKSAPTPPPQSTSIVNSSATAPLRGNRVTRAARANQGKKQ